MSELDMMEIKNLFSCTTCGMVCLICWPSYRNLPPGYSKTPNSCPFCGTKSLMKQGESNGQSKDEPAGQVRSEPS